MDDELQRSQAGALLEYDLGQSFRRGRACASSALDRRPERPRLSRGGAIAESRRTWRTRLGTTPSQWSAEYARRYHHRAANLGVDTEPPKPGDPRARRAARAEQGQLALTYVGHATVLIDMDGTRILTDPVLRYQFRALRRHAPDLDLGVLPSLDAVLVSHFHLDHLNPASLWLIPPETLILVPEGGRKMLRRYHLRHVIEMTPGRSVAVGALEVTATHAEHDGRRYPWGPPIDALGFLVTGSRQVYFAGDTSLFQGMQTISDHIDVALLPVWGWGRMKQDHLSPHDAALTLRLLRPRVAVPIHWGSLLPQGLHRLKPELLTRPPEEFAHHAARLAPHVQVHVIEPGASLSLPRDPGEAPRDRVHSDDG